MASAHSSLVPTVQKVQKENYILRFCYADIERWNGPICLEQKVTWSPVLDVFAYRETQTERLHPNINQVFCNLVKHFKMTECGCEHFQV
ncbi:hypothetical protein GOODEAATRI_023362 [Goodea atripinnis]|uniref:Uncharacterized protein n=1 Tax=Goodea atripinnis TaxID=208336 RepID=A0ABV0Q0H0_9TELE